MVGGHIGILIIMEVKQYTDSSIRVSLSTLYFDPGSDLISKKNDILFTVAIKKKINAHPVVHRDVLQLAISKTAQDIMN